jgi:hypothetical protein
MKVPPERKKRKEKNVNVEDVEFWKSISSMSIGQIYPI